MYICDTGAVAGLLAKVVMEIVMEINRNEAFAGEDIGVDEKVSVRQGFDTFLCIRMMLGSKHANLMYECITYYIYAYQLRCTKQDVLRTSKLLPKVVICINIIRYTC